MQPGFELRIRTMIKAMREVVIPALDPQNSAAVEQANLVSGSLSLLMEQIDYAHWFECVDIQSHCELAGKLAKLAASGAAFHAEAAAKDALAITARTDVTLSEIREKGRLLRDAISELIESLSDTAGAKVRTTVAESVLAHSEMQISRERAFVAKTNFDVYPETLLDLPTALSQNP